MRVIKFVFFITLCLLLNSSAYAQVVRKYSNEFLAIGVGARALGMSNATVAITDDVTSGYWNPAGLLNMPVNMQVGLMHAEYFAGIAKYDYIGFAKHIDSNSTLAISYLRFGVDNIPNTTELIDAQGNWDYNRITKFSATDNAFLLSYARRLKVPGLRLGGNVKIIRRVIGDFAGAWGFGVDAGAQYDYKNWHLGATLRDATSTFNAWSYNLSDKIKEVFVLTNNEIPTNSLELTIPKLLVGAARRFDLKYNFSLLAAMDLDATFDGKRNVLIKSDAVSIDPHLGLELGFRGWAFLRAGLGNFQTVKDVYGDQSLTIQPNIGVGLRFKQFAIDYALTDIGDASVALYSNIFSIKFDINKQPRTASAPTTPQ
jgi:hypothetical protein